MSESILPLERDGETVKHHSDITHRVLIKRLKRWYSSVHGQCFSPKNFEEKWDHTPDLIVIEGESKIAVELKVGRSDMDRATFQCRHYHINGLEPYLFIPVSLYEERKDAIEELYLRLPENMPGLVLINKYGVNSLYGPNYSQPY